MTVTTNDKKREIMNASIYLFSNKGYSSTSVQDIATYCNISKATIYKLFDSKDLILVEILKYFNNQMIKLMNEIDLNLTLTPRKKFEAKIESLLTHFSTKKDFTLTLIQNENLFKGNLVEETFTESKLILLNWLKESCLDYFGDSVKDTIWDLTYSLRGLLKEFSYIFIMKRVIERDFKEVAKYIVSAISYIAENHNTEDVLIPLNSIKFLCSDKNFQFDEEFLLNEWANEIKEIRHTISNSFSLVENTELLESLKLLDLEFNNERKTFLIDALLMYLNKFKELNTHVNYLRKIWIKLK